MIAFALDTLAGAEAWMTTTTATGQHYQSSVTSCAAVFWNGEYIGVSSGPFIISYGAGPMPVLDECKPEKTPLEIKPPDWPIQLCLPHGAATKRPSSVPRWTLRRVAMDGG